MPMRKPLDLKGTSMILKKSPGTTSDQRRIRGILAAFALFIALIALPLTACSGQSGSGPSSWKTLGEALDNATDDLSFGYDDNYFVCVFNSGDSVMRVVAKMEPGIQEQIYELDPLADDFSSKLAGVLGGLSIVSAEDITATKLSPEDMQALAGKTGQELIDDGFVFENYYYYGGDQTSASYAKGNFSYSFNFDASVSEDQSDDGGAALKDAKVISVDEWVNISDAALDPSNVE